MLAPWTFRWRSANADVSPAIPPPTTAILRGGTVLIVVEVDMVGYVRCVECEVNRKVEIHARASSSFRTSVGLHRASRVTQRARLFSPCRRLVRHQEHLGINFSRFHFGTIQANDKRADRRKAGLHGRAQTEGSESGASGRRGGGDDQMG